MFRTLPALVLLLATHPALVYGQLVLPERPTQTIPDLASSVEVLEDVDLDGDLDALFAGNGEIRLYLNHEGTFATSPAWSLVSGFVNAAVLGDVTGNGYSDLLFSSHDFPGAPPLSVFVLENAAGTFSSRPSWNTAFAGEVLDLQLADINDDGGLDLVVAATTAGAFLFENTGNAFSPLERTASWSNGLITSSVAVGDVDNDGDLDLACGNGYNNPFNVPGQNTLYLNQGGGAGLADTSSWTSFENEATLECRLGDMDGNGHLDLVSANWFPATTTIHYNREGILEDKANFPITQATVNNTSRLHLGDVDHDGNLDVMRGNGLFVNRNGDLEIAWVWQINSLFWHATLGDVDGDGLLDLVSREGQIFRNETPPFRNMPSRQLDPAASTFDLALGDVDGDGDPDVVSGDVGTYRVYVNDDGVLSQPVETPALRSLRAIDLGDVSGDGLPDLVGVSPSGVIDIHVNRGGHYSGEEDQRLQPFPPAISLDLALGDIDGDGDLDLATANSGQGDRMYRNTGASFEEAPIWTSSVEGQSRGLALEDLDGDGDPDLVIASREENLIFRNDGGVLTTDPVWQSLNQSSSEAVAVGDVNGDGLVDLAFANLFQANTVYLNRGGTTFSREPDWVSEQDLDQTMKVALADVDGDGHLDLVCANGASYLADTQGKNNKIHFNEGGTLGNEPASWTSLRGHSSEGLVHADLDQDGDQDLVFGNHDAKNSVYLGIRLPVYSGDPVQPKRHLPANDAFLRAGMIEAAGENMLRVTFSAVDIESDPVWVIPQYRFQGQTSWSFASTGGTLTRRGPFESSPEGVTDSLTWNYSRIPGNAREVTMRLRVVSIPRRVAGVRQNAAIDIATGILTPIRPELHTPQSAVVFFQPITVGDAASMSVRIENAGSRLLEVRGFELTGLEMRLEGEASLTIAPGGADSVQLILEPVHDVSGPGSLVINSNDLLCPRASIPVTADIRALEFETQLLTPGDEIPLGEAVTVIVSPLPEVTFDRGWVFHRAMDSGATFADSIALTSAGDNFVAVIPGRSVTERGLEYYVRLENGSVVVHQPSSAPVSGFRKDVADPEAIRSVAPPTSPSGHVQGQAIRVDVILPDGATFVRGRLLHRPGGGMEYTEVLLTEQPVLGVSGVIPDSAAGPRGVEYWVEVTTLTATLTAPSIDPASSPLPLRIAVPDLSEPGPGPDRVYGMVSIPLDFGEEFTGTLETLLSDQTEYGLYDPVRWRCFRFDPVTAAYSELKTGDSRFKPLPGRAFWLIAARRAALNTAPVLGRSVPTDAPAPITLEPGWNQIGNPFAFPVAWGSISTDSPADVGVPVRWNGERFVETDVLRPFEGVFVYNNHEDSPVTILVHPNEHGEAPGPLAVTATGGWRVTLDVSSGPEADRACVGVDPAGSPGFDPVDRFDPPLPPASGISVYVARSDRGRRPRFLATDIRDSDTEGHAWHIDVVRPRTEEADRAATLHLEGLDSVPASVQIRLWDRLLGRRIDPRVQPELEFLSPAPERRLPGDTRFVLLAGTSAFVENLPGSSPTPILQSRLLGSLPNPFRSTSVIRYELVGPGEVRFRIFDLRGRLIRSFSEVRDAAGRYEVLWDGSGPAGAPAPAGVYFLALHAGRETDVLKMIRID